MPNSISKNLVQPVKKEINRIVDDRSGEWIDRKPVRLGDYSETVLTPTPGVLYARMENGRVIKVHNAANVPPDFDLPVTIARNRNTPKEWQIISIRRVYDDPAGGGRINYHHEQHEFIDDNPGPDTVWVGRKQNIQLTILVSDAENFVVTVYGAVIRTSSGLAQIDTQTVDLSSYVPATGAVFVTIQSSESGVLSVVEGVNFESLMAGSFDNVPDADADKYMLGCVVLFEAMTELENKHVFIPYQFYQGGTQVATWGNITGTLSNQADLQAALDAKADADHIHEGNDGHIHGLARWNGASAQTTFDLPDIAEYIESVLLNGLEEDPLVYSLSTDGTQIVLDTGLPSAQAVFAHYVIAGV